ncbi:hypothetical protein GCM10009076_16150 [Erythrobacter ramosus]
MGAIHSIEFGTCPGDMVPHSSMAASKNNTDFVIGFAMSDPGQAFDLAAAERAIVWQEPIIAIDRGIVR